MLKRYYKQALRPRTRFNCPLKIFKKYWKKCWQNSSFMVIWVSV